MQRLLRELSDVISIRKVTPIDETMIEFTDNNIPDANTKTTNLEPLLYTMQEQADGNNIRLDYTKNYCQSRLYEVERTINALLEEFGDVLSGAA